MPRRKRAGSPSSGSRLVSRDRAPEARSNQARDSNPAPLCASGRWATTGTNIYLRGPSRCYQAKMLDCDRKLEALMAALSHPDSGLALVESTRADDIEKTGGTPQASGGYVYGPRAFDVPGYGFPKPRRDGRPRGGVLVIARAEKSPAEAGPRASPPCSIADRGNRGPYEALGRSFLSIPQKTSGRLSASHLR
jgi:hypothetical protein